MQPGENTENSLAVYSVWTFRPGAVLIVGIETPKLLQGSPEVAQHSTAVILAGIAPRFPRDFGLYALICKLFANPTPRKTSPPTTHAALTNSSRCFRAS